MTHHLNGASRAIVSTLLAISGMMSGASLACEEHAKAKADLLKDSIQVVQSGPSSHAGHAGHVDHSKHSMEAGEALKDKSIYHATGEWTDSTGKSQKLSELRGNPVVIAMAYTRCQYVCPRIVADMKAIQSKLPKGKRADVKFVFLSLDSEHDRPSKLREYAVKHKLDASTWTLAHGDEDAVQESAALLGVKYKKESNGVDYAHSYIITLLDKDGVIQSQRIGASEPKEKIIAPLLKM